MSTPWYPGDVAVGSHVESAPQIFAAKVTYQKGQASLPYGIASPGTVATGGTVSNPAGVDAVVYASATTGISASKVGTVSVPGSVSAGTTAQYLVPAYSTITISYTGTLSWVWLAT